MNFEGIFSKKFIFLKNKQQNNAFSKLLLDVVGVRVGCSDGEVKVGSKDGDVVGIDDCGLALGFDVNGLVDGS